MGATIWATANDVAAISAVNRNVRPFYFVQDDERTFKHVSGEFYSDKGAVEKAFWLFEDVVVNSDWVDEELKKLNVNAHKIGIGVDTAMFYPREKPTDRIRVMAHCRHSTPRRGWPFIESVMNRLALSRHVEFVTYDEQPLELQVPWHGNLGRVSPEQLAWEMSTTHIFIEGSELQGWGMQSMEAMACGCALVSTKNKGIDNYGTDWYDCVQVEYGNVDQTVAYLCQLIDNNAVRETLSRNARKTMLNFDWNVIVDEWERYLLKRIP